MHGSSASLRPRQRTSTSCTECRRRKQKVHKNPEFPSYLFKTFKFSKNKKNKHILTFWGSATRQKIARATIVLAGTRQLPALMTAEAQGK
jgi:hypothetical protein